MSDEKGDTTSQESQGQVDQEGQVDQDQQDTEVETALDATTESVQKNIEAIKTNINHYKHLISEIILNILSTE